MSKLVFLRGQLLTTRGSSGESGTRVWLEETVQAGRAGPQETGASPGDHAPTPLWQCHPELN